VLHHLAAYGPLSEALHRLLPGVMAVLFEQGRLAVQVFLVVGGYLAARGLSSSTMAWRAPWVTVFKRYRRLLPPYIVALGLAMLCAAWARPWLDSDFPPAPPTLMQWLAHVGMLQGILDFEALSAGVWYVAMDLQLFALLAGVLWLGRGTPTLTITLVALACAASLAGFNRYAEWDNWAVYFFGAYGLGALAWWAQRGVAGTTAARAIFGLTLLLGTLTLVVDFRVRIALAMALALMLATWGGATGPVQGQRRFAVNLSAAIQRLSLNSYALFLVHFPVLLCVNAAYTLLGFTPSAEYGLVALGFGVVGWLLSLWVAQRMYRWVESPTAPWRSWVGPFGSSPAAKS
jgi:peptidoglycan/LPS O-acetylase OafA/YrhL